MKKQSLILALSTLALVSCAKTRTEGGTDGVTHWLMACETSAECGELECLCGVCTAACDDNAACSAFGATARCSAPDDGSCTGLLQICQRPMSSMPMSNEDGGAGDTDGAVALDGGPGPRDSGPVDAGEPAVCKAMDARSSDLLCATPSGFAWDGTYCVPLVCGCVGADCGSVYATAQECELATFGCTPLTMCVEPSDCVLVQGECCNCGVIAPGEPRAVSSYNLDAYGERTCNGRACEACAVDPLIKARERFVPTCGSARRWEGGECRVVDLAGLPCTPEVGCRVRVARCCECGADPTLDQLFGLPNDYDAEGIFCDRGTGCCEAEPRYPDNVEAVCAGGYCVLEIDGELYIPGQQ